MSFVDFANFKTIRASKEYIEMSLEISPNLQQAYGFLHGGVTIALLESAASVGAALNTDLETQLPFGTLITVRHRKPGKSGTIRGIAELSKTEERPAQIKQTWAVRAIDEEGDVISEGEIETKIVARTYLAEKEAQRHAATLQYRPAGG